MIRWTSIDTHCSGCLRPAPADEGDPENTLWIVKSIVKGRGFLDGPYVVVCPACHQQALPDLGHVVGS
mgnify:FL=1|jgi:hypothetical protein